MLIRLAVAAALLFSLPAFATTVLAVDIAAQAEDSSAVVEAVVRGNAPFDSKTAWYTDTTLEVQRVLGGSAPASFTVRQMGGNRGDKVSHVPGDATLREGDRVVAFVRQIDGQHYLTALAQSVWVIEDDGSVHRDLDGLAFYAVDEKGAVTPAIETVPAPTTLEALEAAVKGLSFAERR